MTDDRIATLSDFRDYGALFGIECAQAATRKQAEGLGRQAIREHVAAMERAKRDQLASIGASDIEMECFTRTAGAACFGALGGVDLLGILNRRQRRARHTRPL